MRMQEMLTKAAKAHNKEFEYLERFNRGLRFKSMTLYNKKGYENIVECSDGVTLVRYELKFYFKADDKYDNNIVKYMFNMYSDGTCGFYFDGTEWEG